MLRDELLEMQRYLNASRDMVRPHARFVALFGCKYTLTDVQVLESFFLRARVVLLAVIIVPCSQERHLTKLLKERDDELENVRVWKEVCSNVSNHPEKDATLLALVSTSLNTAGER